MKIPAWFIIGCGLLVLNLVIVLGGTLSRHASAEPPRENQELPDQRSDQQSRELQPTSSSPVLPEPGNVAPVLPQEPIDLLPTVPSLDNAALNSPSIVSLEEVKKAVGELQQPTDLLAPLDAIMKNSEVPVSEQLSHSFFESMKLRLKTVNHLNQSSAGLVDEAAILYQRGEIAEAQKLLGLATQLRETTARLLVTHQ